MKSPRANLALLLVVALAQGAIPSGRTASAAPATSCKVIVTSTAGSVTVIDVDTAATSVFPSDGIGAGGPAQFGASFDRSGTQLYIAASDNTIRVFDATSFELIDTINQAAFALTSSPVRDEIYALDYSGQRLIRIDTTTNVSTGSAQTGVNPADLVVSPDGEHVYVADSNAVPGTVTRVDASTLAVVTVPVSNAGNGNSNPNGLSISPDGRHLFVAGPGNDRVVRLPTAGFDNPPLDLSMSVDIGDQNYQTAITSDGSRLFVASSLEDLVHVIDTTTFTSIGSIVVGTFPLDLAVTPDGEYLYVANFSSNSVSKVRLSNQHVENLPIGMTPSSLTIGGPGCWPRQDDSSRRGSSGRFVTSRRVTMDPNGGTCMDPTPHSEIWASTFVGRRYLPNASDCTRPDYVFTGWTHTATGEPVDLPLLTDPASGTEKHLLRSSASLTATWSPLPGAIDELFMFANFLCGPCTSAWFIHTPSDHATSYDYALNNTPVTCAVDIDVFGLRACQLPDLTSGTVLVATVTPRNTHGDGPVRTTTFTLTS